MHIADGIIATEICIAADAVSIGSAREIASNRALLRDCGLDFHFYCDVCHQLNLQQGGADV